MSSIIQQISNTNLHHIHGIPVTNKGKQYRQSNVTFNVKGRKQVRLTRAQCWITHLTKLRDGFPIHLVDQAEELSFKPVLLPTYKDYVVQVPFLTTVLQWEDLELFILPGFLGNAICRKGKVWELYIDTNRKEWYWQEVYPNQNECYDLVNSIDGDMLEVSVDDIIYLMKSNVVTGDELADYYAKRVVSRQAEAALDDGWVETDPIDLDPIKHAEALTAADRDNLVVLIEPKPKTVVEAFLAAYKRNEPMLWDGKIPA